MVRRKNIKTSKKEMEDIDLPIDEKLIPSEGSRLHRIKKRSSVKQVMGISLVVIVLLLGGWFTTKLALSGWNISSNTIWKDFFSLSSAKLIGEEDGRINMLLLGNPGAVNDMDGPYLTDTVMVASVSIEDNTGLLFSLPRDLYVKIPGYGNSKLNAVYKIGDSQNDAGGQTLAMLAGDILGLDIPYYMKIDFTGFEQLIDELGGVTVEVEKDLYDDEYPTSSKGYEILDIKAGTYTMDGTMALKYARSRQSTSDFDRARRQQKLLVAIRDKSLSLNLLSQSSKALAIIDVLNDSFETNLTLVEMKRMFDLMKDFDLTTLTTKVFDDSITGLLYGTKVNELYVLRPVGDDFEVISDYVAKIVSGETTVEEIESDVITEPLKVEVLNGTNITGLAGKIAARLRADGYEVILVGNNALRGFTKSIVYDLSDGNRILEVRRLAASLSANIGEDEITSTSGAQVRIVLGSEAE